MQKVYHRAKSSISNFLQVKLKVLNSVTFLISLTVFFWVLLLPPKFYLIQSNNSHDGQSDNSELRVDFQNIGQGDSTLFIVPNGNSFLVDAGPFGNFAREEIGKNISIFDNHIDVIVGTHPDSDHVGGFESFLKSYSTSLYIDPGFDSGTSIYKNLKDQNLELGIKSLVARKGVHIILDEDMGVMFETLFPDINYVIEKYKNCVHENQNSKVKKTNSKKKKLVGPKNERKNKKSNCEKKLLIDTNDMSIVGQLKFGSTSIMMTGDAPVSVEDFITRTSRDSRNLKSQILKVGHHGSETSTSKNFLDIVDPDFAIISVGKENRYGHPNKKVLERLQDFMRSKSSDSNIHSYSSGDSGSGNPFHLDAKIIRTDIVGHSIEFITEGKSFVRIK